jgi:hypothetical protein
MYEFLQDDVINILPVFRWEVSCGKIRIKS